jgi:hypothetical protein
VFQLPPNNFQQELAHISCFSFFHVKTTWAYGASLSNG